jgi:hypothetical protein
VTRRTILSASSAGVRALGLPSTCTQADCAATWDERENGDAVFSGQALQSDGLACSLGGRALASRHPCQLRPHPLDLLCTHASAGAPHLHLLLATLSSFINLHYVWSWRLDCTWATLVALACVWVAFVHVLALLSLCPPAQMLSDVWGCCRGLFVGVQLALNEMNRCAAACMWSCMYVELPLSESRGWTRSTSRWVSQRQCERRTAALVV